MNKCKNNRAKFSQKKFARTWSTLSVIANVITYHLYGKEKESYEESSKEEGFEEEAQIVFWKTPLTGRFPFWHSTVVSLESL